MWCRGFPDVLVSYPISNIVVPVWYAEGVSQFQTRTARYDYRDSHREMILRDRILTGKMLTLDEMGTFGKNSIGNESSYNLGFDFVRYLAAAYGDTIVTHMAQAASGIRRLNFKGAIKEATGVDTEALYQSWVDERRSVYEADIQGVLKHQKVGEPFIDEGIGNMFPTFSPDGKKLALLATGDSPSLSRNRLEIHDLESGEVTPVVSGVTRNSSFSPDGRYLAYAKITPVVPSFSLYNDIYVYDTQTGKTHRLTKAMRARHPAWSHDGQKLAFIVETDGLTNLTTLDLGKDPAGFFEGESEWTERYFHFQSNRISEEAVADTEGREMAFKGAQLTQLTRFEDGRQIYHPQWSPKDDYLIFDTSMDFGRDIARIPANGGDMTYLLSAEHDERYPIFDSKGNLWYSSDETGIFNIYSLNLTSGEKRAHTNVPGGAFMPAPGPEGELFYALYQKQAYQIYRMKYAEPISLEKLAYIDNYEERIPDLGEIDQSLDDPLPPRKYKRRFSKVSFMPRLLIDYGTVKPGLYLYTTEVLNKLSFFAGGDLNRDREYNLFGILDMNLFGPDAFLEFYNQTAKIQDRYNIAGVAVSPEVDVSFNLLQTNAGLAGLLPGWKLGSLNYRLEYIYSWYRAKLSQTSYTDPANNQFITFAPVRYSYLRGHAGSLLLRNIKREPSIYGSINPRHGRYLSMRYTYEYNNYLQDFATDRAVSIEQFKVVKFNRLEMNWEQFLPVPKTKYHALNLRFQGGFIDAPVDSFFHFFGGGLVGLKGYPFYSIEGTRNDGGNSDLSIPARSRYKPSNRQYLSGKSIPGGILSIRFRLAG